MANDAAAAAADDDADDDDDVCARVTMDLHF